MLLNNGRFTLSGTEEEKSMSAKQIVAHVVTSILGDFWSTTEEAMMGMNTNIATALKLDRVIKYITLPSDVSHTDYDVIIALSTGVDYDFRARAIRVYKKVLSGELTKFPNTFFDGPEGRRNLYWVLEKFTYENVAAKNQEELFTAFANTDKIKKLLSKKRLSAVCDTFFLSSPLDMLVFALGNDYDPFLYTFYQHESVKNSILSNEAKEQRKIEKERRLKEKSELSTETKMPHLTS